MKNPKVTLALKRNKVTLDIDIKVVLLLKGEKATLVMHIKSLSLSKKMEQLWSS